MPSLIQGTGVRCRQILGIGRVVEVPQRDSVPGDARLVLVGGPGLVLDAGFELLRWPPRPGPGAPAAALRHRSPCRVPAAAAPWPTDWAAPKSARCRDRRGQRHPHPRTTGPGLGPTANGNCPSPPTPGSGIRHQTGFVVTTFCPTGLALPGGTPMTLRFTPRQPQPGRFRLDFQQAAEQRGRLG